MSVTRKSRGFRLVTIAAVLAATVTTACSPGENRVEQLSSKVTSADEAAHAIMKKWQQLGGADVLGQPTAPVAATVNGAAYYRTFANAPLIYSDDFGVVYLSYPIFQKWLSLSGLQNSDGVDLFDAVGVPVENERSHSTHVAARFVGGAIIDSSGQPPLLVHGHAWLKYCELGATGLFDTCGPAASALGLPVEEERAEPGAIPAASVQAFEFGELYVEQPGFHDYGTVDVFVLLDGAIRTRWNATGRSTGTMGAPAGDELPIEADGQVLGTRQSFARGAVYASAAGAWEVLGLAEIRYRDLYGGPAGWLGFPTTPSVTTSTGVRYNDFQGGVLAEAGGMIQAFKDLSLHIQRIEAWGPDCIGNLCAGVDVFVHLTVERPGDDYQARLPPPPADNYGGGAEVNLTVPLTDRLRPEHVFRVKMVGTDDDVGPDDALGSFTNTYSVDNMWGVFEPVADPSHSGRHEGKGFRAHYSLRTEAVYDDTVFQRSRFWSFQNVKNNPSILSYDTFAATFSDVDPGESPLAHPLNRAFYNLVYKELSQPGNCFGMSLESGFVDLDASLFTHPIHRYPESYVLGEINMKHGYQVGSTSVAWVLSLYSAGLMHNPKVVFAATYLESLFGRPPVLSFSTYFGQSGHSVRPFRWDASVTPWRIYVADPNHPSAVDGTFVEIHDDNSFTYNHPDCGVGENLPCFAGGEWLGSRLYWHPFDVVASAPRTPMWDVAMLLTGGWFVFLGGGASSSQISDEQGRTLFEPSVAGRTRWDELRVDASSRIPDFGPIPFSGGPGGPTVEWYAGRGAGATLEHVVVSPGSGEPSQWMFHSGPLSAIVDVPATGTADVIEIRDIETVSRAIALRNPTTSVRKEFGWTVSAGEKRRWLRLDRLSLEPGQEIELRPTNGGYRLNIVNLGAPTSAELTVKSSITADPVFAGVISIPSGESAFTFATPRTTLSLSGVSTGDDNWTISHPVVTLVAQDYSGTGIAAIEHGPDGVVWTNYSAPFAYTLEGTTDLFFRARDNEGNEEDPNVAAFKVDTRSPLVTVTAAPHYTRVDPFVIDYSAEDPVPGSGLRWAVASLDGENVIDGQAVDLFWFALGPHVVSATARDVAGWQTTGSATFSLVATLGSLRRTVLALRATGDIDDDGILRSLLAKIDAAQKHVDAGDRGGAAVELNLLDALQREIAAQEGHHISARASRLLTADLLFVRDSLQ